MALSNQQVFDYFLKTPGMSDAQILAFMRQNAVSPSQIASTFNMPIGEIVSRLGVVIPPNEAVLLGDTYVQSIYDITGSGENQQIGALKNILTYKEGENKTGGAYNQYLPTGELERTGTQQKVDNLVKEFLLGSTALFGGAALAGLGGTGAAAGTAATVGTTGLTAAELAQLDLALGGVGGTTGATTLGTALTTGATVPTITSLTGGSGLLTGEAAGITTKSVADKLAADALANTTTSGLLTNTAGNTALTNTAANTALTNTAANTALTNTAANTALTNTAANTALTNTAANTALTNTAANTALTNTAANTAATALTATQIADLAKTGLTAAQIAQLFSAGATTASGLLQQQTSKEAAQKAQAMIDAETASAKASAQFRPIGMTTRFGSSQFGIDPLTGRLTSAGYTLSPEAKAAQDRFVKLAETGIQQAEGAQQAFKPLQTGAESLFKLGAGYLAEKPEDVAKNYLASQMALLKPGRELELANLQNRLQQQGRGGLSVAQGGTMGATTPELQALYNARAQQEAVLAANAQQAGQQQVAFGAGLLGTGAQTMGQYYGGQQAAYAPYTTAMGQITGLEALGQQPFTMGTGLAQQTAQAGANVGQLGLRGAEQSVALATGRAATTNPYATLLGGVGSSDAFGKAVGGLFSGVPATTAMSALPTTFGTGSYYGSQDLGLFL
jgi:hypothetical protein